MNNITDLSEKSLGKALSIIGINYIDDKAIENMRFLWNQITFAFIWVFEKILDLMKLFAKIFVPLGKGFIESPLPTILQILGTFFLVILFIFMVCFWTYLVFAIVWYIGLVSIMGNSSDEAYAKVTSPLKKLFQNMFNSVSEKETNDSLSNTEKEIGFWQNVLMYFSRLFAFDFVDAKDLQDRKSYEKGQGSCDDLKRNTVKENGKPTNKCINTKLPKPFKWKLNDYLNTHNSHYSQIKGNKQNREKQYMNYNVDLVGIPEGNNLNYPYQSVNIKWKVPKNSNYYELDCEDFYNTSNSSFKSGIKCQKKIK